MGRDQHLASVSAAVDGVRRGAGGCLLLLGEAGSGKTRLLSEGETLARAHGMAVLSASPSPVGSPPPYGLLAQVLRSWTRTHREPISGLDSFAVGLRQILPEWPAPVSQTTLSSDQMRLLILEAALRLLIEAARPDGAVVILDDLQMADPETRAFIHHAAASIAQEKILLLGAVRTLEGAEAETEARVLARRGTASILDIEPLVIDEVKEMVLAVLRADPPPGLVEDVYGWTDGVPLLIEEILEAHFEAGTLRQDKNAVIWSGAPRTVVPRTTLEIVRGKLRAMSDQQRKTVAAAAVLDRFEPELLRPLSQSPSLAGDLEAARDAGLIDAETTTRFRHALVREAVLEALVPIELQDLHLEADRLLEELRPDLVEERAHHLEALGESNRAAELLIESARRSLDTSAPFSAEQSLRRAIDLAGVPEIADRARDVLIDTLGALGRWEEALIRDGELISRHGDTPDRLIRMARHALHGGKLDEATVWIDRAEKAGADQGVLRALSGLLNLWNGDLEQAVNQADRAVEIAQKVSHHRVICDALDVKGRALDAMGKRAEARPVFELWIDTADRASLTMSKIQALMELGNLDFLEGGSSDRLLECRDLAISHGALVTQVLADLSLGWWHYNRLLIHDALRFTEEAAQLCRRLSLDLLPHALNAVAWAKEWIASGIGEALLREAEALDSGHDVIIIGAHARGERALRSGKYEEAVKEFTKALQALRDVPAAAPDPAAFMLVSALVADGKVVEAREVADEVSAHPARDRQWVNSVWIEAGLSLANRSPDDLAAVMEKFRGSGETYRVLLMLIGADLWRESRYGEPWAREALSIAEQIGFPDTASRAKQILRSMGASVPRAKRPAPDLPKDLQLRGVTRREAEVLRLIASGRTNAEIAEHLYLSVRTVEGYVSRLLAKLGRPNRAALAVIGHSLPGEN